jgi:DNA polymerase-3 subunit alpha
MTQDRQSGQNDLFGDGGTPRLPLAECESWMPMERLSQEYEAVGFYLSGHPLDAYSEALAQLDIPTWREFTAEVREKGSRAGRLAGTVTYRNDRVSPKNGNKYAFIGISDPSGQYEVMVFAETLDEAGATLAPGQAVVVRLEADYIDEEIKLRLNGVRPLEEVVASLQRELSVFIRDEAPLQSLKQRLAAYVMADDGARPATGRPGLVQIIVLLDAGKREVELRLPGAYRVNADIAGALKDIPGVVDVHLFGGNGR